MQKKYGFGKTVSYSFDTAQEKVRKELEKEGFGVLTEIDVAAILKKKLDKQMPSYLILGACNPQLAHCALEAESSIGLLLPCNVIIRQDEHNRVHVEFMDPNVMVQLADNPEITSIAAEANERLKRVMKAL